MQRSFCQKEIPSKPWIIIIHYELPNYLLEFFIVWKKKQGVFLPNPSEVA